MTTIAPEVLGLPPLTRKRHAVVVDLSFGDAGKGAIVDWLTSPAAGVEPIGTVVRFNGGAQAAHNVVRPDGRHHTFAQFGSGTFNGWATHLSRFVLVDPLALGREAAELAVKGVVDPFRRFSVDPRARLTTPFHAAANRAKEIARGEARHGSCGRGIGETMIFWLAHPADAPTAADTHDEAELRRKLAAVERFYREQLGELDAPSVDEIVAAYADFAANVTLIRDEELLPGLMRREPVVFEGAQGVLLDEWRGFDPYTTWSTTTFANAETLLAEAGMSDAALRIGVLRAYTTRHGAGPFPTEDADLTRDFPDVHNGTGRFQGIFRAGHLDLVMHRYAIEVAGRPDILAVTHLDRAAEMGERLRYAAEYEIGGERAQRLVPGVFADLGHQRELTRQLTEEARPILEPIADDIVELIERELGVAVGITAAGPATTDKAWRTRTEAAAAPIAA